MGSSLTLPNHPGHGTSASAALVMACAAALSPTRAFFGVHHRPVAWRSPSIRLGVASEASAEECSPPCILEDRKGVQYIGKSVESFKLADLYWLESCVVAHCQRGELQQPRDGAEAQSVGSDVVRLAFHRPTASYLLGYTDGWHCVASCTDGASVISEFGDGNEWNDIEITTKKDAQQGIDEKDMDAQTTTISLPFRRDRFQYVARVIASGQTPLDLLQGIEHSLVAGAEHWVLDSDTFEPLHTPGHPTKTFTSAMLMCAVARVLPGEPSLTSADSKKGSEITTYMIVETAERLYLAEKISYADDPNASHTAHPGYTNAIAKEFRGSWSRRPFQYSGAINLDAAFTMVDILRELLPNNSPTKTVRILDPTCGSGTFLALTLMAWGHHTSVQATGIDSNDKCAQGTAENLKHLFPNAVSLEGDNGGSAWELELNNSATILHKAKIYCEDSARLPTFASQKFDCAVANLPWNRNTFEFNGMESNCTNTDILKAMAGVLKPGSPLVVVCARDRGSDERQNNIDAGSPFNANICLRNLGFQVLGEATIPPTGFELPASGKKKSQSVSKKRKTSNSDCVITVAVAPR